MAIECGKLNRRVSIQRPAPVENELGELSDAYVLWNKVWAKVAPIRAGELEFARKYSSSTSHKITIRYVKGMLPTFRVAWQDGQTLRHFSIEGIVDPDEAHVELWLFCTEKKD